MPTHRRYIERTVWLIAGSPLLACTAFAARLDPMWVLGVFAVALASLAVALTGFILAGTLVLVHTAWWAVFPAFVGIAMLVLAATGFCIMANTLYWMGAEPRLAPAALP